MIKPKAIFFMLLIGILVSCQGTEGNRHDQDRDNSTTDEENNRDCGIEDGTQIAVVDYYNPATGYNASYSLNVDVENCQVVRIDFNSGGYLDEDHIDPADIDDNGDATIEDDRGRTFEVHIQK